MVDSRALSLARMAVFMSSVIRSFRLMESSRLMMAAPARHERSGPENDKPAIGGPFRIRSGQTLACFAGSSGRPQLGKAR